jgi:hypothetical protein
MGCVARETAGRGAGAVAVELCAPTEEAQVAITKAATNRESL